MLGVRVGEEEYILACWNKVFIVLNQTQQFQSIIVTSNGGVRVRRKIHARTQNILNINFLHIKRDTVYMYDLRRMSDRKVYAVSHVG